MLDILLKSILAAFGVIFLVFSAVIAWAIIRAVFRRMREENKKL